MAIENDCIISKQADVTIGFKVALPEIFSLSETDYERIHASWVKAIKVLPSKTIVHKQDWYIEEKYRPQFTTDINGDVSFLSRSFQEHFVERPYLTHMCYLFVTLVADPGAADRKSSGCTLVRSHIIPKHMLDEHVTNEFLDLVFQFRSILESDGYIKLTRLTEDDYLGQGHSLGILDHYLNLSLEDAAVSDIEMQPDRIIVNNRQACIHAIANPEDLPLKMAANARYDRLSTDKSDCFLSSVASINLLLKHNHIYNQYIFIDDAPALIKDLERKAKRMTSLSKLSRNNEINAEYINLFLTQHAEYGYKPVHCHCNVISWGAPKHIDRIKNDTAAGLSKIMEKARLLTADVPVLFWASLPGNESDLPRDEAFMAFLEVACCFINNDTSYKSSLSPFGIKMADRFTLAPLHVDISDEPMKKGIITNRNKFILGPSGSGKSFFTNHMVRQYYEQGTHIVLVDTGNSYLGLCEYIHQKTHGQDGIYITYTNEHPIAFNPFYTDDRQFDIEKKESIKTLITTLWKTDHELVARSEEVGLSRAVHLYIGKIERNEVEHPDFNGFYEFVRDEYIQTLNRENVEKEDFNIGNFLHCLKPYYQGGEYDYLLNSPKQIDLLSKRFVVFELDNIKDHPILFPVVTIIIMETFINKMRHLDGIRKMILIEEAWKAIAKEGMADYIKYLFKTVRKFFGEAVVVTQEADDIISSPIVKETVITNADCKILLDQSKYMNKFEEIQNVLGLTEKQRSQVLSINKDLDPNRKYKEVFIGLGSEGAVYATEVSTEEYLAYTTEQSEKLEVLDMAAKKGDIELAIKELADRSREKRKSK